MQFNIKQYYLRVIFLFECSLDGAGYLVHLGGSVDVTVAIDFRMNNLTIFKFDLELSRHTRDFFTFNCDFSGEAAFQLSLHLPEFGLVPSPTAKERMSCNGQIRKIE